MGEKNVLPTNIFGKDAHPSDTATRIKGILAKHGIETEECWFESDVPHCYSLRINIAGTTIGANGKGIDKEYALASGYGELIERLQLGLIWRNKLQIEGGASSCEAQSLFLPSSELLARTPDWYASYAQKLQHATGSSFSGEDIIKRYTNSSGNVQVTPYYCLTTQTTEYLPTALCKSVYATNGGAAGNTMEEAMVQAFSEIVERNHKLRIIFEEIAVPEISEDVLKSYPTAYEIICFLRSKGYRIIVKDCSLGTKFPVVCVCIIDTNTGKYHTHFGAFPDFNIALQRTLTESFQGRNLRNIAGHEDFSYNTQDVDSRLLLTELVKGTSEKTPQFFFRTSSQPYAHTSGFSGTTNRDRLKECIAFFTGQGYDILVRDSSTLGFPTCQIIIPGYSEALPQRILDEFNDNFYSAFASRALRNPVSAGLDDLLGLYRHITQSKKLKINGVETFTTEAGIPAQISAAEEVYFMCTALAHISYTLGRTADVIAYISKAIQENTSEHTEYLLCIKRYLSMQQKKYSVQDIAAALKYFHNAETIERFNSYIQTGKNPLDPVVLCCDFQCSPNCCLHKHCKKKYTDQLADLIIRESKELDQSALKKLLKAL